MVFTNTGKGFFTHEDRLAFSLKGYQGHDGSNYVEVGVLEIMKKRCYWLKKKRN